MKKNYGLIATFIFCFLIFSCDTDKQDVELIEIAETEYLNYEFGDEIIRVTFTYDEDEELVPIQDSKYRRIESIFEEYPELTLYSIDDNNVKLFVNDLLFDEYLESLIKSPKELIHKSSSFDIYRAENMRLYENCCYDSRTEFSWGDICVYGSVFFSFEDQNMGVFNNARLWDFSSNEWIPDGPQACGSPKRVLTNPNDKLSSIQVFNVAARLYEHAEYKGRSLFIEGRARFGKPNGGGIKRLKKVRFGTFHTWSDKTSSIRLYE